MCLAAAAGWNPPDGFGILEVERQTWDVTSAKKLVIGVLLRLFCHRNRWVPLV